MKFAQFLSENLVPEWKVQYLDYKAGKKKLKNLDKERGVSAGLIRRGTLASLFQNTPVSIPQTPGTSSNPFADLKPFGEPSIPAKDLRPSVLAYTNPLSEVTPEADESPSLRAKKATNVRKEQDIEYSATDSLTASPVHHNNTYYGATNQVDSSESSTVPNVDSSDNRIVPNPLNSICPFELPPPALTSTHSTASSSKIGLKKSTSDLSRGDSTIRKRDPKVYPELSSFIKTGIYNNQGTPKSVFATNSLRRMSTDEKDPKSSSRRISGRIPSNRLEDPYRSPDPLNDSEKDFLAWADDQLNVVNSFYREREKEAVQRYNLIHIQLHKLLEQKDHAKMANKPATSRLDQIQKRLDFPSLPTLKVFQLDSEADRLNTHPTTSELPVSMAMNGHTHAQGQHRKRMEKEKFGISYIQARTQLKLAVIEFYRSLELLKTYKNLNLTAFQKILKKFDKTTGRRVSPWYMDKVQKSYFSESHKLDDLLVKVENIFGYYFENGNRKQAIERLRSKERPDDHYGAMFISGLFIGMAVPFLLLACIRGGHRVFDGTIPDVKYLLQLWGGFFLVLLFLLLFTINCAVWVKYKINYPFIFEFDIHNHLDFREFCLIPSYLTFIMSLLMWLSFENFWPDTFAPRWFPPIFLGISAFTLFVPLPIFQWRARKWLLLAILRLLLSGLYPIEFRDFFLGDIFGSMTYSISNLALLTCLYSSNWVNPTMCNSSHSKVLGFLNTVPAIWRFLQCIRRYMDTGDWFPHLANTLKYSFTIVYYMTLSIYRIEKTASHRTLFIFFATINSVYCSIWDILMDWSLLQPGSKNVLLRDNLGFKSKWPYHFAMIIDPLIRFNWIFYIIFSNQLQQSQLVSFLTALTEIFRRFIWVFIRMENEHCTNVGNFKAARDLPLPYTSIIQKEESETGEFSGGVESVSSESQDEESRPGLQPATKSTVAGAHVSRAHGPSLSADASLDETLPGTVSHQAHTPVTDLPSKSDEIKSRWLLANKKIHLLDAFSSILRKAHAADFERRRPRSDNDFHDSDDDDEVDEDFGHDINVVEESDEFEQNPTFSDDYQDNVLPDIDDKVEEDNMVSPNDEASIENSPNQSNQNS